MIDEVHAVVLTYNRRELILQNLASLRAQTHPLKSIIVVDNGSTDGTEAAVRALDCPIIDYVRLEPNIGAAPGFAYAMDTAFRERQASWIWIMDDDMIPEPTALAELVAAYERNFERPEQVGFLVSQAIDGEGRANNVPTIDAAPHALGESAGWARLLDQGIVFIRTCALNALLLPRTTYAAFGGLNQDFVVWGEDSDLTFRITEQRPGLLVGRSKVTHLRGEPGDLSILLEHDPNRIPNFYYWYRNTLYVRRRFLGPPALLGGLGRAAKELTTLVKARDWTKAGIVARGTLAGLLYRPKPLVRKPLPERSSP